MAAHNEAAGIEYSLDSVLRGLHETDQDFAGTLTVIANGCSDTTSDVAGAWGKQKMANSGRFAFRVIELAEGHKSRALNEALTQGEGDITMVIDADVTLDPLALHGLSRVLTQKKPLGASLYHAADPNYLPEGELGTIVRMADLRRQAIPTRLKLHGGFMGWTGQTTLEGKRVVFPTEQPVADDTWLSYALIAEHGTDVIHSVNSGVFSRYVPPQNHADYIRQQSRYAGTDELVAQCFPALQETITTAQGSIPPLDIVTSRWQKLCAQQGIDFDANIGSYDAMRTAVNQDKQRANDEILANKGQWLPVSTARLAVS